MYGREMILDVRDADPSRFTRDVIRGFFTNMCNLLGLTPEALHFWDYEDPDDKAEAADHLKGTTAVQFITTSSIVVHTLDVPRQVYINVFTCGDKIDHDVVCRCAVKAFGGEVDWTATHGRGYQ